MNPGRQIVAHSLLLAALCVLCAPAPPAALAGGPAGAVEAPGGSPSEVPAASPAEVRPASPGEPPEGLSAEAWGAITGAIERDRYGAHPASEPGELEAANPAQGYAARFGPGGVTVSPGGEEEIELALSLTEVGFGEALSPVPPARPRAEGQRVEYVRGEITEWYVNRPSGLEQGWTLASPPGEPVGGEPLRLVLAVGGGLEPVLSADGAAVELRDAGGRSRLRYAGLKAWDATGRELASRLEAQSGRIGIAVAAGEAVYPVTVDPTIVNDAKLLGEHRRFAFFGDSVAVSGSTVVVGAWQENPGSAYVFEEPAGSWGAALDKPVRLLASDRAASDQFGRSVAVSGSTVVVGAWQDDDNGDNSGSAYVFERPAEGWAAAGPLTESAKLLAKDGGVQDYFGRSVAVSGSTVVVGAWQDDDNGDDSGSAYVFERPAEGWAAAGPLTESAKLLAKDGAEGDQFGFSIAVSGSTIVVGAHRNDDKGDSSGSAYVFTKPAGGWTGTVNESAKLLAKDGSAYLIFGESVAVSGSTVVVGAWGDENGKGSAYVFEKPAEGWAAGPLTESAKLLASDGAAADMFGASVAISGSTVVVGARRPGPPRDSPLPFPGSAYVFTKPAGGWTGTVNESAKLLAKDGADGDRFGQSVAVSGSTVVVGAPYNHHSVKTSKKSRKRPGSAYVFDFGEPSPAPVSVEISGLSESAEIEKVRCLKLDDSDPAKIKTEQRVQARAKVTEPLSEWREFDCEAAGLEVESGDKVQIGVLGKWAGPQLEVKIRGLTPKWEQCANFGEETPDEATLENMTDESQCDAEVECRAPQELLVCEKLHETPNSTKGKGGPFAAKAGDNIWVRIRGTVN